MDTTRAFLAIVLSFIILIGYQYFFVPPPPPPEQAKPTEQQTQVPALPESPAMPTVAEPAPTTLTSQQPSAIPQQAGRDIRVETDLFSALVSEAGGGIKSFKLKKYMESINGDSDFKELIKTEQAFDLPLYFSWGVVPEKAEFPVYKAEREQITVSGPTQKSSLTMKASMSSGLEITRTLLFDAESYIIRMNIDVYNASQTPLQGSPYLTLANKPFSDGNRFLFAGPAVFADGKLQEIKPDDIEEKSQVVNGNISWVAYEGNYFMTGIIPEVKEALNVKLSAVGEKVNSVLSGKADVIPVQGHASYEYKIYFGPKKLSILKSIGNDLDRIINFGWFDFVAKPTLQLLNFLYTYVHNYGVAIILVTILFKIILWPVAQKGMKSMKNMQKIQPKVQKLREKYKDDSQRLNQEMMNLYKTYKVNPLGGCLPMVLQIPVFFALYKVLLQAIELRHAPFMLWITDLSAPDRLWIGFDLPYLGGLPVLTLLMGGSMFLQQKMTPSPADPTQAKIMMFLPVIFTFMFLNFASGLVLYWFINNLLSIGQQYLINRPTTQEA